MKSFTKTTTITYEPIWVHFPFMTYDDQFKSIRDKMKYKYKTCFRCNRGFVLNEQIGLGCFKNIGNKVLCKDCSIELQG